MSKRPELAGSEIWVCGKCQRPMELRKVSVTYMDGSFPVDLPVCPSCGQVFVPEELALGKMAEVEKALEDK